MLLSALKKKLKLRDKVLIIPVVIVIASFIVMGMIFLKLIVSNAEITQHNELSKLIESKKSLLYTSLSLLTSTQAPGDAMLGLQGDDDEMAIDLVKQAKPIGVDGIYFTDLKGNILFPEHHISHAASAFFPSATNLFEKAFEKKSITVGTPIFSASFAGPSAGSMPNTGMP